MLLSRQNYNLVFLFSAFSLLLSAGAVAQQNPDSSFILDSGESLVSSSAGPTSGHVTTIGAAASQPFFSDIYFDFDIARDLELVQDETGFIVGYYLLDGFGGQHEIGNVTSYNIEQKPYFSWDIARDLEVVNTFKLVTDAVTGDVVGSSVIDQVGYYVVDGWGGVHPINNTVDLPYRRGSSDPGFKVFHDFPSAYPSPYNYPYFYQFDIVRDMEVSYIFTIVTMEGEPTVVGKSNGYYLLDGYGGVHNAREDLNGNPLMAAWENVQGRPYFGWDIARDMELTPRGDGYYILDGFGGIAAVNANLYFGEGVPNIPPYIGYDIAKDMEMVQGVNGSVIGYYVLDGLGIIHVLGNAPDLGQVVNVPGVVDIFRDLEVSPLYTPVTFAN